MPHKLSIVLPCYEPMDGWVDIITDRINQLRAHEQDFELIVVNDGSKKDLEKDVAKLESLVPELRYIYYQQNRGKGYAVRKGIEATGSDCIIYTDIDFPYTFDSLLEVYNKLKTSDYDIVAGIKDAEYYKGVPLARKWISKILKRMSGKMLKMSITDTQCGLKGFTRSAKYIWEDTTVDRYLFDLEALYTAERKGLKVLALPVRLRDGVVFSKLRLNILLSELSSFMKIVGNK